MGQKATCEEQKEMIDGVQGTTTEAGIQQEEVEAGEKSGGGEGEGKERDKDEYVCCVCVCGWVYGGLWVKMCALCSCVFA